VLTSFSVFGCVEVRGANKFILRVFLMNLTLMVSSQEPKEQLPAIADYQRIKYNFNMVGA